MDVMHRVSALRVVGLFHTYRCEITDNAHDSGFIYKFGRAD